MRRPIMLLFTLVVFFPACAPIEATPLSQALIPVAYQAPAVTTPTIVTVPSPYVSYIPNTNPPRWLVHTVFTTDRQQTLTDWAEVEDLHAPTAITAYGTTTQYHGSADDVELPAYTILPAGTTIGIGNKLPNGFQYPTSPPLVPAAPPHVVVTQQPVTTPMVVQPTPLTYVQAPCPNCAHHDMEEIRNELQELGHLVDGLASVVQTNTATISRVEGRLANLPAELELKVRSTFEEWTKTHPLNVTVTHPVPYTVWNEIRWIYTYEGPVAYRLGYIPSTGYRVYENPHYANRIYYVSN